MSNDDHRVEYAPPRGRLRGNDPQFAHVLSTHFGAAAREHHSKRTDQTFVGVLVSKFHQSMELTISTEKRDQLLYLQVQYRLLFI